MHELVGLWVRRRRFLGLVLMIGTAPATATAAVTIFTSAADFLAATQTTLEATYENFAEGIHPDPVTDGRVIATHDPAGGPLWIGYPGGAADASTSPHLQSGGLMANGNEVIDLTFSGVQPTAIGFETITNFGAPPQVSVYDTQRALIASFGLPQAANTRGYLGILSDVPIGRLHWVADRGEVENTVIDNVRIGAVIPVAVQPAAWQGIKQLFR